MLSALLVNSQLLLTCENIKNTKEGICTSHNRKHVEI